MGVCRALYARNLTTKVPKSAQPWVLTLLRTVFDQPDAAQVAAQFIRVVEALAARFPAAAEHLTAAESDLLAFCGFPREVWRQVWSHNPRSGSTGRSAGVPTWSASSPTVTPSSGWSARC
jgi:transposase-like protein